MPIIQNVAIPKKEQGNIKSEIDVANVLLQLKEKDEQILENINDNNNNLNKYQKSFFKSGLISLSPINSKENKNFTLYNNNNPYCSPSSTVYSSPVIGYMDNMDNDNKSSKDPFFSNKEKEDYSYRSSNVLPPISYLLETKVVNSPMKDNILPIPDIPSFKNKLNNISGHLEINSMEINKEDLFYYKSFNNQHNDFKVSRKSSYSSARDNDNKNYNIPNNQNSSYPIQNNNSNYNNRFYPDNKINNYEENVFSHSNPSPNSDHMYNIQNRQSNQPSVSLPPPSIKVDQNSFNEQNKTSYNTSHYPSNNEKDRLVRETHLTHRQINDWFINKRARSSNNHQNKRRRAKKLKQQQQDDQIVQNN
ncbi:hypothetical protein LY90DRAFT_672735 [Neocallimastix californiae]|uniref:Homeobox domain-containing protein n=1 Tax=Neocallimastix californiae TaxID=1754190 RepID=A0A1Y2BSI3_9FUNG|nr:hypothetical protein LY90DRAFT_672735 [Neocallimastix californiae]|eukprot:ORY37709.1 hypothetical protein LY90DRAFT_672735 [Neocallimastix californiae]